MSYAETERVVSLLKSAIRLSNFTYRDVERQLGWRVGTITRLLRGGLGLKIEHLLSILQVIHFSPGRFFAAAYPVASDAGPNVIEDRLHRMLEQLHGEPEAPETESALRRPGSRQDEIDEMVRASLRRLIASDASDGSDPSDGKL
jgi:transcriptional regulator with XRE-family HTH domain